MKTLAIDASGMTASVAIVDEEHTLGEISTHFKKNHAETLMPMISQLTELLGINLCEMDFISCAAGPGSFTGLRIGAATAKAIAYAHSVPIAPVPTLDALAYNALARDGLIIPLMDARRNQVYTAFYKWRDEAAPVRITGECAVGIEEALKRAAGYDGGAFFIGDGAQAYSEIIIRSGLGALAPSYIKQRASAVGAVGIVMAKNGSTVTSGAFVPYYLRKPQAEREREERMAARGE